MSQCAAEGAGYRVQLQSSSVYTQTSINTFGIRASTEPCPRGQFNTNGGTDPGCQLCDIGTYAGSPRSTGCTRCRDGITTLQRGSTQIGQCNTPVIDPTEGYMKFDMTYFYHSNAGGTFLDTHQHKTQVECMQFCKKSPGCKAFDSGGTTATYYGGGPNMGGGRSEVFQQGDCFVSFDNVGTIKTGDVGSTPQLELFQKVDTQTVKDILFRKTPQSFIRESNDGGAYKDEHSPEACAQLCLNDFACVSFDAGQVEADPTGNSRWQTEIDDCFLSYKSRADVPAADFITNPDLSANGLDYFERITPMYLEITSGTGVDFVADVVNGGWTKAFVDALPNNPVVNPWITALRFYNNNNYACARRWDNCTLPRTRNPGRPQCPNPWSYQEEYINRFPHLAARDQFQQGLVTALRTAGGGFPTVALRVEEKTSNTGVGQGRAYVTINPAEVVDAGNTADFDTSFDQAFPVGQTRNLLVNRVAMQVVRREAVRCAAGYVSQSGNTPGCQMCPPDTFSNFGQTDCVECPLGMVSDAASSIGTSKACRPAPNTLQQRLGPFRVGYEWFGWYTATLGSGDPGHGQMRMRITSAEIDESGYITIEVFASAHHGETCGRGCRDPGLTEFLMSGDVQNNAGQFNLNLNPGAYSGITDRNRNLFIPEYISTTVSVRNRNNIMTGDFGDGTIKMYERCHSAEEQGDFQPGNLFVGTYSCYRVGTDMASPGAGNDPCSSAQEGNLPEKDIYRFQLTVTTRAGNRVGALVEFDWMDTDANGQQTFRRGEYAVSGNYSNVTQAIVLNAENGAWNTPRNLRIPARQLSGRLSDDAEFFNAQLNANPNCACNGESSNGMGATCGRYQISGVDTDRVDTSREYCVVDISCPDSGQIGSTNVWVANCNIYPLLYSDVGNIFQTCTDVTLARVCSSAASNCEAGWLADPIQGRCHKSSAGPSPFVEDGTSVADRSWTEAKAFCETQGASLVSVHSVLENQFLMNPAFAGLMQGSPPPRTGMWIGLVTETAGQPTWDDNTSFSFTRVADQSGTGKGYVNQQGRWQYDADGSTPRAFTCWKMPVGAEGTCECIGLSDSSSSGGYCNFWDGRSRDAWCYVSNECRGGVKFPAVSSLARAACPYRAPPGSDGYFTDSANIRQECDIRCGACDGPGVDDCTACQLGSPLFFLNGACVTDCHMLANYKDNATQTCVPCSTSSGQIRTQCSEYANTVCESAAGCSAGQGPIADTASGCCEDCEVGVTYSGRFAGTGFTCLPLSPCLPGFENTTEPTLTSDRQCSACTAFDGDYNNIAAATYQPNTGSITGNGLVTTCLPVTPCPLGQGATSAPTDRSDTDCEACPADANGQWFSLNGEPCQSPTRCGTDMEERIASTASTDRVCWPTCYPGNYTRVDTAMGRVCRRCARGTFSTRNNMATCEPKTRNCQPGEEITAGSMEDATQDTSCRPCVRGIGFSTDGAGQCESVTECGPNFQESAPATISTDRVCVAVAGEASSGEEKDSGSDSMMLMIVVVIAILLVVVFVIIAMVVVKKAKGPANDFDRNIAFENPLYDQATTANPTFGDDNTYSEPNFAEGDGYMDVPADQKNNDGGGTGYMDVSPDAENDASEEEEEDI